MSAVGASAATAVGAPSIEQNHLLTPVGASAASIAGTATIVDIEPDLPPGLVWSSLADTEPSLVWATIASDDPGLTWNLGDELAAE